DRLVLRDADTPDRAAGVGDLDRGQRGLLEADALEHRMGAVAVGELTHALDGLVAAFADDVGRAEFARERYPVRVAAEEDDPVGAQALGGDDAAQADGAVADDRGDPAGTD